MLSSASLEEPSKTSILKTLLSHPDHVMYAEDITVPHVDPDGSESEAILLPGAMDGDWRMLDVDHWRVVSAGGRVTGGGVG